MSSEVLQGRHGTSFFCFGDLIQKSQFSLRHKNPWQGV